MGLIKFIVSVVALIFILSSPSLAQFSRIAQTPSIDELQVVADDPLVQAIVNDPTLGSYQSTIFINDDFGELELLTVDNIPEFDFSERDLFYTDSMGHLIKIDKASIEFEGSVLTITLDESDFRIPDDQLSASRIAFGSSIVESDHFFTADDFKLSLDSADVVGDQIEFKTDMSKFSLSLLETRAQLDRSLTVDLDYLNLAYTDGLPGVDVQFSGREIRRRRTNYYVVDIEQLTEFSIYDEGNLEYGTIATAETGTINQVYAEIGSITFDAQDSNGGANRLDVTVFQDKEKHHYYLESRFHGGDSVVVEAYSFRLESEKVGDDAVAGLEYRLKEHDINEYLQTMAGLLDFDYINDFLAVSDGKVRVSLGGRYGGVEFIYMNPTMITDPVKQNTDEQYTLGVGIFSSSADREYRNSVGILLSSDSSIKYDVHHGDLSWKGYDLPDEAEIPGTFSVYFRRRVVDTEFQLTFGRSFIEDEINMASFGIVKDLGRGESFRWHFGVNDNDQVAFGIQRHFVFHKSPGVDRKRRTAYFNMSETERKRIIHGPFEDRSLNF